MKVLLNTTTSHLGGALQVASTFIQQALRNPHGIEWVFATSDVIAKEVEKFGVPASRLIVFERAPTRSLSSRRRLLAIERDVQPDCVLTIAGPAYVRFRSFHVLGCSTAWVTHATWGAVRSLGPPSEWAICVVRNLYKAIWFRRANAWIAQTETGRRGLAHRLHLPLEKINVVSNTCGEHYLANQGVRSFPEPGRTVRLLCFAAAHRHKNLRILPHIAVALRELAPQLDFRIVVTLPTKYWVARRMFDDCVRLGVADLFENRGPTSLRDGPALYRDCDICLLPTLLETFSATYPESMAMGLPIVTSDLDFAHDVCDDAALYYSPQDPRAAAETIVRLLGDRQLWESLIARGKQVLTRFPTPQDRYEQYIRILTSYCGKPVGPIPTPNTAEPVQQA